MNGKNKALVGNTVVQNPNTQLQMKYFIQHTELDHTIKEIKTRIRTSMNGVVADTMNDYGAVYKQNFGVNFPRLREISLKYAPNHDLAQRLWALQIRETMILATLLEPPAQYTPETADEWLHSIRQPELAEQTCMNLFSKLSFADELCLRWTASTELWHQITGFILAARIWSIFNDEQIKILTERAIRLSDTENFHLYKAVAQCLSRCCRKGKDTSEYIVNHINKFENSNRSSEKYVYSEVINEVNFLY